MVFLIDDNAEEIYFPDPHFGDADGCFAIGGDLSIDRLLLAYSNGIFPWYSFRDQKDILWYCPMQRFVIFPEEIHVSHSMRTLINKKKYTIGINEDFGAVIRECSKCDGRYEEDGAWLGEDIIKAYTNLHEQGFAASVEVWDNESGELVGGLYGVTIGKVFIGESMFSLVPSASKLALVFLARFLQKHGGKMIDCQLETPHLKSMGGRYISYEEYMEIMNEE
jgi:leucyl/phenylalanyl-tRNA---protein transferase